MKKATNSDTPLKTAAYREAGHAVARLADELSRHLLLLPQEIDVLIEVANGGISEAELARLRAVSLEQDRQHRLSYLSPYAPAILSGTALTRTRPSHEPGA
jgi:DNA-binding CsgD family transcriptional regulator